MIKKKNAITTAVIGLGRIAWSDHLPVLANSPDYKLVAIVDPSAERRNETITEFQVPAGFATPEEMYSQIVPDLTVIASPTCFHARQTVLALKHGSHVFCDKPVAMNYDEAQTMFDAARRYDKKLVVYQPRRFFADVTAARSILASGKLGKIFQIKLFVGDFIRRNDWQALSKNGGGMLSNYGAHYIDELLYLLHEHLTLRYCRLDRILSLGDAEDVVKLVLESESGILLDIDINQATALESPGWRIYGNSGTAENYGSDWRVRYCNPAELSKIELYDIAAVRERHYPSEQVKWYEERFSLPQAPSAAQIYYDRLQETIRDNAPPAVSEAETLELISLIDQARINAAGQRPD